MGDCQRKYVKFPNFGVVTVVQVGVFVKSQRDVGASPTGRHTIFVFVIQVVVLFITNSVMVHNVVKEYIKVSFEKQGLKFASGVTLVK